MKTILLYVGAALFLVSCNDTSKTEIPQNLPDDEMKARVEAEEILFENERTESDVPLENRKIEKLEREERVIELLPGHADPMPALPERPILKIEKSIPALPYPSDGVELKDPDVDGVYSFPEVEAQFPGGVVEMRKFFQKNLEYPSCDGCYQGRVYVTFIVEKDGKIKGEKVFRGAGEELDQEALRVIRAMPNWIPAENDGKVVAAKVRLPISFTSN